MDILNIYVCVCVCTTYTSTIKNYITNWFCQTSGDQVNIEVGQFLYLGPILFTIFNLSIWFKYTRSKYCNKDTFHMEYIEIETVMLQKTVGLKRGRSPNNRQDRIL